MAKTRMKKKMQEVEFSSDINAANNQANNQQANNQANANKAQANNNSK